MSARLLRRALVMDGQRGDEFTIGLFGIGLDAYWPQFAGLEDRLKGHIARVAQLLGQW
jgi:L-arabinose isomerase